MHARSSRAPRAPGAMTHRGSPIAPSAAELVRTFYEDVLGGRRVWPARRADTASGLWFRVGSTFLEARAADGEVLPPIVLEVDAPEEVAERCWDAGFRVQVEDDAAGRTSLSVIDPFDRRIDLTASGAGVT
jgi:hypothetical protein